jgi:hypothetical protein
VNPNTPQEDPSYAVPGYNGPKELEKEFLGYWQGCGLKEVEERQRYTWRRLVLNGERTLRQIKEIFRAEPQLRQSLNGTDPVYWANLDSLQQGKPQEETELPWSMQSLLDGGCSSAGLATTKIQPREAIFDDWCLVGDLGFIFAARGLGKTWLSMHLTHGAATGTDVGPWKTHLKRKTLYLDGEMPPQDIQYRDRVLGTPTENLIYINHQILFERTGKIMNLANRDFQNAVLEYCLSQNIGLLALDNLSTLASGIDENKSIDWEIIQPWLLRLRRALVTVLFIHHAGRNKEMRGSSKREDPASWVLRLDQPIDIDENAGAHFITRFTKWRSKKQPKTYEWIYEPTLDGEILVHVKEASPLSIFRSHVSSGLDTCSMVAEEMGVSLGYVSRLAAKAKTEGWLEITHRKYSINGEINE